MNTKTLLSLTTAIALTIGGATLLNAKHNTAAEVAVANNDHIVTLPTVTVRPDPADLAIVDLPSITVYPSVEDMATYVASNVDRIVDLPAITVRASAADLETMAVDTAIAVVAAQVGLR